MPAKKSNHCGQLLCLTAVLCQVCIRVTAERPANLATDPEPDWFVRAPASSIAFLLAASGICRASQSNWQRVASHGCSRCSRS